MTTRSGKGPALLSVEDARRGVLASIPGPVATERVPVAEALGRVLAEPVVARTTLPPWDNSAMDGYAVRAEDVLGASPRAPVRLAVVGEAAAGGAGDAVVTPGTAIRIATGAPIPAGADAVVPVEETTPIAQDGTEGERGRDAAGPLPSACLVHASVGAGAHVRTAGSDVREGELLLGDGSALTPAGVALAAGSGTTELVVYRRPLVAVLATGEEVRAPGEPLGASGIPDANGPGIRALAVAAGAEVVSLGIARDRLEDVVERLETALAAGVDAIVVCGGVSVGPYDVVRVAFERIGRIALWRVAVQPGKPFAFGTADRSGHSPVLLFGLPGNPVSGFVTFELFVRPALRRLAGRAALFRPVDRGVLLDEASKSRGRRAFLRVTAERDAAGRVTRDEGGRAQVRLARGPGGQGSHVLSALAAADALAVVPEEIDVHPAGDPVELWWLDRDQASW